MTRLVIPVQRHAGRHSGSRFASIWLGYAAMCSPIVSDQATDMSENADSGPMLAVADGGLQYWALD
jgi:hypothetical protein